MIYLEQTGNMATLTTWIYTGMWQLYSAFRAGKQGYIHWPGGGNRSLKAYQDTIQFGRQPNMFDWYFVQPFAGDVPPRDETWTWEEPRPEMGEFPLMSEPLETIKAWYRQHLKLSTAVNERGAALVAKYGIEFNKTIGVTWRGTDVYLDGRPRLPIELYFPFIDDLLDREPDLRIACTAEEETILGPLLARYPQAFRVEEFIASPFGCKHNPERFTPISGFERGMQPALMVWLFSQCRHYIKNRSSTGAVASWLSTGNIICLAHPETLAHYVVPIVHPKTGEQLWPAP